jgi:hypothetical protein
MIFCDLLWFFKDSVEIKNEKKYKTTATIENHRPNRSKG